MKFSLELQKMRPPEHLSQSSTWNGGLVILDIDSQLSSLNTKWIQRLINPANGLWKNFVLY